MRTDAQTPTVLAVTPSDGGGMLHYASEMVNALAERTRVHVVVDNGADVDLFAEAVSVEVVDFPGSKDELVRKVGYLRDLRALVRQIQPDVVHLTTLTPLVTPVPLLIGNVPLIFTYHDVEQHPTEFKYSYEAVARWLVRRADRVVVHGEYNREALTRKFDAGEKAVVINHGEYTLFRECCDDPLEYTPELLFFGRFQPYKGIDVLVRASKRIAEATKDATITIAGSGSIEEMDEPSGPNVQVINRYLSNEAVCRLFSRCRCVVLPYRSASQTGIIPIAYAFSKPVVATKVGGLPELVEEGETGFLVDPENEDQLADRCIELLRDRAQAAEMGRQARQFSQERLSWDDIAEQLCDAYTDIYG